MFPPVEIEKDKDVAGGHASSSSCSSGSSSSDSSSSSGTLLCMLWFLVETLFLRENFKFDHYCRFGFGEFLRE